LKANNDRKHAITGESFADIIMHCSKVSGGYIMKILVISDTHGDTKKAEQAIRKNGRADLVIHLGDYSRDAEKLSGMFPGISFEYISGNCDFPAGGVSSEKLLEVCGKRIFITHGHRYSAKWGYERLFMKAEEQQADILLFGHTHIPDIAEKDRCIIINPGSASDPRGNSDESYAVIEISDGRISARICHV
jgi:putative phosphoesterase